MREFLHVDDLARAVVLALECYDDALWLNVGSDDELSIAELASMVAHATEYRGEIRWNDARPDGTPRKKLDWSRMRALGWSPTVSLEDGLRRTVEDYRARYG